MSEELKVSLARIACLEGEIAKRDARIAELEAWKAQEMQVMSPLMDYAKGVCTGPLGCSLADWLVQDHKRLRAELAAIKAQEPSDHVRALNDALTFGIGMIELNSDGTSEHVPAGSIYPAPVSEAKAQGVIDFVFSGELPNATFVEVEDGNGNSINVGEWFKRDDGYSVLRLNAAPVQQVSAPDVSAMARILADRNADACNVNREDNWMIYGQDYIDDVTAMLAAAPAAPAADAGLLASAENCSFVMRQIASMDAEDIDGDDIDLRFEDAGGRDTGCDVSIVDYAEKTADVLDALIAAHRAQGVV